MQDELLIIHQYRVARVRTALVAGDECRLLGQDIRDLSFALVTPLSADDDDTTTRILKHSASGGLVAAEKSRRHKGVGHLGTDGFGWGNQR